MLLQVGAYLRQKHGLTGVRRLRHGIIGYERWAIGAGLAPSGDLAGASLWEGHNFIFDQRPQPEARSEKPAAEEN